MTKVKLVDACRSLLGELSADRDYARELHAQAKKLLTRLKKLEDKYSAAQSPVPAAPVYAPDERLPAPAATAAPVRTSAEMPHEPAAPAPVYGQPSPPAPLPAAERPAQETMEKTCSWCRFMFDFPSQLATFPCPACGAVNGRPQAKGMSYDCLKRATHQRLGCDFHNAEISYQHVLLEYPEEHEALWGLALCRYGIEYVDDPRTGRRMPTVHGVRRRPMQLDNDYLAAVGNAPQGVRERYEAEALYVDDAMARIRKLAETQPGFDVFICHKTTRPDSDDPTWECLRASEVAHQLERLGYRVFFAPECMKGVAAGSDYEAAIFHALETSKVMLLFCSEPDYVTSPWVRSEWTRFLDMTDEREDKRLVPLLYGDFTAGKLPREIRARRLEGIPMDSWTAKDDVLRVLEKYCGLRGVQGAAPVRDEPVQVKMPAPTYAPESDFETAPVDGGCSIRKYRGQGGHVNVPPMIGGRKVVEIGGKAFWSCSDLTSITLPEGVTSIGYSAFSWCSDLTSITLPNGMTRIGADAFSFCRSLMSITIPESVTSIGDSAFDSCRSLTSIVLPKSVMSIGNYAFQHCSSLASITLPEGLTSIGTNVFADCSSLTGIAIPDSVTSIGDLAFWGCTSLTSITLPEGMTRIGENAFNGCDSLPHSLKLKLKLKRLM